MEQRLSQTPAGSQRLRSPGCGRMSILPRLSIRDIFGLALTAALASCQPTLPAALEDSPIPPTPTAPQATSMAATSPTTEEPATTGGELDLRYANVTDVTFQQIDEGLYRFNVTLYHDDEGEAPQFADAWQIENLEGDVLGVRQLLHSHGTQPFTRSETIEVPAGVERVIVRGHDMAHGFGGQAIEVNLRTGELIPFQTSPSK